ncbi:hypothetical protein R3P38DRAFT_1325459 [Favolaschia claudopus]|uniref:Secreted protein n=1 Tax=Favolaschia claudopus TaxID=2862362 RepID=A0AAW0AV66_9AGAR
MPDPIIYIVVFLHPILASPCDRGLLMAVPAGALSIALSPPVCAAALRVATVWNAHSTREYRASMWLARAEDYRQRHPTKLIPFVFVTFEPIIHCCVPTLSPPPVIAAFDAEPGSINFPPQHLAIVIIFALQCIPSPNSTTPTRTIASTKQQSRTICFSFRLQMRSEDHDLASTLESGRWNDSGGDEALRRTIER